MKGVIKNAVSVLMGISRNLFLLGTNGLVNLELIDFLINKISGVLRWRKSRRNVFVRVLHDAGAAALVD